MAAAQGDQVPLRVQCAVFGVGMFSTTVYFMGVTIVPLWVVEMHLSPFWLGVVLGAQPVLPLFLSIHTGALMDRMGGRRVMTFFMVLALVAPLLYPVSHWAWAIVVLQLIWGLANNMGWLGAQTLVGQLMHGRTVYAGRLSFASRAGNIVGPPLVGAAWDVFGPWGAFGLCGLWGLGGLVSALMLPRLAPTQTGAGPDAADSADGVPAPVARPGLRALLPSLGDYTDTFRLLSAPTVAITASIGMMVHIGNNIQSTFYVVWLNMQGIPGTLIGTLISIASVTAIVGSLLAAPLCRIFKPYWLLWFVVWAGIALIAITPLFATFFIFALVLSTRTMLNGVHQPLVISLMLRIAGPGAQGKAMGLRATANRVTSIGAPILMGAVAEIFGIEESFFIMGLLATLGMVWIATAMVRHPEIHANAPET